MQHTVDYRDYEYKSFGITCKEDPTWREMYLGIIFIRIRGQYYRAGCVVHPYAAVVLFILAAAAWSLL